MRNVQISQELFMQLLRFHLMEDESCEKEIKQELEKKLDRMVMRDLFGKSKLHRQRKNGNRQEKNIWTGGECRRVSVGNSFLMIRTGVCHTPVNNRQGRRWI